jgi:hypothetical protein
MNKVDRDHPYFLVCARQAVEQVTAVKKFELFVSLRVVVISTDAVDSSAKATSTYTLFGIEKTCSISCCGWLLCKKLLCIYISKSDRRGDLVTD